MSLLDADIVMNGTPESGGELFADVRFVERSFEGEKFLTVQTWMVK